MKLRKLFIGAATLGLLVGPAVAAQAVDPVPWSVNITTAAGSGHDYTGELDPCTGEFTATGTTEGSVTYTETVTGTLTDTTLDYVSDYDPPEVGQYDDYGYSVTATRTDGTWAGTYDAPDGTGNLAGTVDVTEGDPVDCTPADSTGTMTTSFPDGQYPHSFAVDYFCDGTFEFTSGGSGSGTGSIDLEAGEFTFEGANGGYGYTYTGVADLVTGEWLEANWTDSNGASGEAIGQFNGLPDCITHPAECAELHEDAVYDEEDDTCTVPTGTRTEIVPTQTGSDYGHRTTGQGKSQTSHWNEDHATKTYTTYTTYSWDENGDMQAGTPVEDPDFESGVTTITCTQNVTGKNKPAPSICTVGNPASS